MRDLITTAEIAKMFGLNRAYVTDKLVKRHDFPAPVIEISQKTRKWLREDVERFARPRQRRAAISAADSR